MLTPQGGRNLEDDGTASPDRSGASGGRVRMRSTQLNHLGMRTDAKNLRVKELRTSTVLFDYNASLMKADVVQLWGLISTARKTADFSLRALRRMHHLFVESLEGGA